MCPGAAPVGATVTVTGTGCKGVEFMVFLGPHAFNGSGGGGVGVSLNPEVNGDFRVHFVIPASYAQGGDVNTPLPVVAGNDYQFQTAAYVCGVPFTVSGPIAVVG